MLGASGALTLVTVAGLLAGLGREWLLVAQWGATARTDAFLIALFLPEAVRMIVGNGLLSSAAMAPWQSWSTAERAQRLSQVTFGLMLLGAALAGLGMWLQSPLMHGIGPGLETSQLRTAADVFAVLVWTLPLFILQGWWSVPLHAQGRYVLPGAASLAYNLPAVACLAWMGPQVTEMALAWCFLGGAAAAALMLWPAVRQVGLPWRYLRWSASTMAQLGRQLGPLLGSALMGQGVTLLERVVASYLGDGVITLLNLARKLANLPLVALTAVCQVVLGLMARGGQTERLALLKQGLAATTTITTPAAVGLLLSAPAIVALLFPGVLGTERLAPLLGWYAVALVIAGWNALLARYCHARGDTRLPFLCDVWGSGLQALAMPVLAWGFGLMGLAAATLLGVSVTAALLLRLNSLQHRVGLLRMVLVAAIPLALGGLFMQALPSEPWARLAWATLAGAMTLALVGLALKPWRGANA